MCWVRSLNDVRYLSEQLGVVDFLRELIKSWTMCHTPDSVSFF